MRRGDGINESWTRKKSKKSEDHTEDMNKRNCSSDREKLLRSLEQFIQTVKGQNNFW